MKEIIFEKKVSAGNILEMIVLLAGLVWATAFAKSDIDHAKNEVKAVRVELQSHLIESRETQQRNDAVYVRKDVLDQMIKRLDDIQNSINRIDQKVSR